MLELALMLTVGRGCGTDTVAVCVALPPSPVHVREKMVVSLTGGVWIEPEGNGGLVLQSPPDKVQLFELASE